MKKNYIIVNYRRKISEINKNKNFLNMQYLSNSDVNSLNIIIEDVNSMKIIIEEYYRIFVYYYKLQIFIFMSDKIYHILSVLFKSIYLNIIDKIKINN